MNIQDQHRSAVPYGFKFRLSLEDHVGPVIWLSWSPDGQLLASCSADESVNIWDVASGRLVRKVKLHNDAVLSIAWSPDGKTIASGSHDESLLIWDPSGRPVKELTPRHSSVNDLAWSHDGRYLAAGFEDGAVKVFDKKTFLERAGLTGSTSDICSIVWTGKDRQLITSSYDGKVKIWDAKTWKLDHTLDPSSEAVFDLAISPNNKWLAGGLADGRVVVWDTQTWSTKFEFTGHGADVTCVKFSHDGRFLASKSFDGTVKLWTSSGLQELTSLVEPSQNFWLSGLAFHPSQLTLATLGAGDTIVRIWDLDPVMLDQAAENASPSKKQSLRKDNPPAAVKLAEPPDELVKACVDGECVVYVGAGLAAQSGLPLWNEFVQNLVGWGERNEAVDEVTADSLREALATGNSAQVADLLVSEIGRLPELQPSLNAYLAETFVNPNATLPEAYKTVSKTAFSAALTTNFDNLLESAYERNSEDSLTPHDTERLLSSLQSREFFILKLFGIVERPETVMLSPAQFEASVSENVMFSRFIESLFVSKTLFFVGASLEGIEFYLKALKIGTGHITRKHFALVAVTGTAWRVKADILARRYGINVIPFTPSPRFAEVGEFLNALHRRVGKIRHQTSSGEIPAPAIARAPTLKSIELLNIGPFASLSLNLNSQWNVLLGDNGVGKSSILKAIAVGFAGEDARPFADRLVKAGSSSASITLEFDDDDSSLRYITKITLTDSGAEIRSFPDAPIRAKKCLALGFPALRAMLWERGPDIAITGRERPTSEDLMPLIDGRPDPRLDNLRSWLVQLDHVIRSTDSTPDVQQRYKKLRSRFFKIIERLTPGLKVKFKEVDAVTKKVLVETDDGVIPIELVSQGTTSLLGWIGVFLQRYFDVYGDLADLLSDYSLVLVDEIDAHMHPQWQRTVVSSLSKLFPKAQFIVTTHSPLIVAGLEANQVMRFARGDDGTVVQMEVLPDMTVGYSDHILTSDLFGLESALDESTVELQKRYQELLGITKRTRKQEAEFRELSEKILFRVPPAFETYHDRRRQMLSQGELLTLVGNQLAELSPEHAESGKAIKMRGEKLLSDMGRSEND